ncbi:outer membrane protein assembly factor BamB [Actinoplanes octamycinicus]|uniref:Outer membrane protein assembly factor BamB n=1 Tax=Actinoplanes octamycinicus TaxID=135948 RepID=A0A7W7H2C8_9ACTN|nr:PQQ-binding-like beta-propeller repeat protein [Actinoplanes octamycinicus]MBB4742628.1 outer membrane protein assembly factor BamB [Actinoplanes octamycinicus]GIE60966.1 hypothetical protein Aoc01nite_63680 [Actinoplanes octamycinicus]
MPAARRTKTALLSLLLAAGAPVPPVWDHPGFDAADSYANPHESGVVASSVGRLTRQWRVTLRDAEESCARPGPPVLAQGRLFVHDRRGLAAHATRDGARVWSHDWLDPGDASSSQLALDGGVLVAATSTCRSPSDITGQVTVLDAATGRVRWQEQLSMPADYLVVDRGVVVVSGSSGMYDDAATVAYAASTGTVLWKRPHHLATNVSAGGLVLLRRVPGEDEEPVPPAETSAVAIGSGAARWTRPGDRYAQAAGPDRIYVTDGAGGLAALRAADGSVVWRRPIEADEYVRSGRAIDLLAVDPTRIYRAYAGAVEALDAATGRQLWRTAKTGQARQPVVAGDLVYTGGPVLRAGDGKPARASVVGDVVVAGGRVYQVDGWALAALVP